MITKMTDADYFALPAISNSLLSRFAKCPADVFTENKPTAAMNLGTCVHSLVLDGVDEFHSRFYVAEKADGRTKEGKALKELAEREANGRIIINTDDMRTISGMADSIFNHPSAIELLHSGRSEVAITWEDQDTGLPMKSKADYLRPNILIDLKTTQSADQYVFQRTIWNMGYAMQLGLYQDGLIANLHPANEVLIIAVENSAPYCCNVFRLSQDMLEYGKARYKRLLREYKLCKESNVFPSYQYAGIVDVELPAYARE